MHQRKPAPYAGVLNDKNGGLTDAGRIVLDAWVFQLVPESETAEGWTREQIQNLYDRVSEAWAPFGHLVSRLPPELRQRHETIYSAAIARARKQGWNPELGEFD